MIEINKIYNIDCLSGMKSIPDNFVHCILTDPPYATTNCSWETEVDLEALWKEWKRILKPNGVVLVCGSEPFSSKVRLSNLEWYKYDLYWVKEKPVNFFQLKRRFGKTTENIMVFYKEQPTYNPQMVKFEGKKVTNSTKKSHTSVTTGISKSTITPYNDTGYRYPTDILRINREKLGSTIHETQKPLELAKLLIKSFTNEGDIILDCFSGSGTFALGSSILNRDYIAFEKDTDIYNKSIKRLEEYENKGLRGIES